MVVWVLASASAGIIKGLVNTLKDHTALKMVIPDQVPAQFMEKVLRIHMGEEHALHIVNVDHHSLESLQLGIDVLNLLAGERYCESKSCLVKLAVKYLVNLVYYIEHFVNSEAYQKVNLKEVLLGFSIGIA